MHSKQVRYGYVMLSYGRLGCFMFSYVGGGVGNRIKEACFWKGGWV